MPNRMQYLELAKDAISDIGRLEPDLNKANCEGRRGTGHHARRPGPNDP